MFQDSQTPSFRKTILAASISLLLASSHCHAKRKLVEIQGLPQTEAVSQIRSGKDGQGNVLTTWIAGNHLYLQQIAFNSVFVAEPTLLTTASSFDHDLAVNSDGSYLSAWATSNTISWPFYRIKGLLSANLATVLDMGTSNSSSFYLFSENNGGYALVADGKAKFFDILGQEQGAPQDLGNFEAVSMDENGDFILGRQETPSTLSLQKGSGSPTAVIPFAGAIQSYDFGEGRKPNNRIDFEISDPRIASNDQGDILVVWKEKLVSSQRKPKRVCIPIAPGNNFCFDDYTYSAKGSSSLIAQRFNNDLSPKDPKPIAVIKGKSVRVSMAINRSSAATNAENFSIAMDQDGDFAVAYILSRSAFGYFDDLFVKQFSSDRKGKLRANKSIKLSTMPKTGHRKAKGKIRYSTQNEPNIVITNDANNDFLVVWHNDFEDHYQDPNNLIRVCTKYDSDDYCIRYKYVPDELIDEHSVLKAKRYSTQ